MNTCNHPNPEMRLRTLSNKTTAVYMQCPVCGQATSQAISKNSVQPELLPELLPFDETLRETYWATQRHANEKEREKQYLDDLEKRRAEYEEYLNSPAWHYKREQVLERDQYCCRGCMNAPATEVHHLTYAHVFDELLFELVAVCKDCHDRAHPEKRL